MNYANTIELRRINLTQAHQCGLRAKASRIVARMWLAVFSAAAIPCVFLWAWLLPELASLVFLIIAVGAVNLGLLGYQSEMRFARRWLEERQDSIDRAKELE